MFANKAFNGSGKSGLQNVGKLFAKRVCNQGFRALKKNNVCKQFANVLRNVFAKDIFTILANTVCKQIANCLRNVFANRAFHDCREHMFANSKTRVCKHVFTNFFAN